MNTLEPETAKGGAAASNDLLGVRLRLFAAFVSLAVVSVFNPKSGLLVLQNGAEGNAHRRTISRIFRA